MLGASELRRPRCFGERVNIIGKDRNEVRKWLPHVVEARAAALAARAGADGGGEIRALLAEFPEARVEDQPAASEQD